MIPLTSIGARVSYAVEETKGVRPTTGYSVIKGMKSTTDFNISPETFDTTTFDNLEFTTTGKLLKSMPEVLEFSAVLSQEFYDTWGAVVSAFNTAIESSKMTWFCIDIPGLDKSFFIAGEPISLGMPALEVNSGIDIIARVIPLLEPIEDSDPDYNDGNVNEGEIE